MGIDHLFLNKLNATILGTTSIGGVVSDWFVRTLTHSTHVEGVATQFLKGIDNSLCTLL